MNIAFALSFGANGIAYAVFNLARPGTRTPGSFALEGRGLFNWIAVVAMVAFVIAVIRATERQRPIQWLAPLALGVPGLLTAITNGQAERIDLLAFGGTIIYPTTAFALGALAAVFAHDGIDFAPLVLRLGQRGARHQLSRSSWCGSRRRSRCAHDDVVG